MGYTAAHMTSRNKAGLPIELQITGNEVYQIDPATHLIHDLWAKRLDLDSTLEREKALKPIQELFDKLNSGQMTDLDEYQRLYYRHKRNKELGIDLLPPELPKSLPKEFDLENLNKLSQIFGLFLKK